MASVDPNYTVGKGELFLGKFVPGTKTPGIEHAIGNCPSFTMNFDATNLDHFSSQGGIREKDASVPVQVNRSASVTTDDIKPHNVARFFLGTASVLTQAAVIGKTDAFLNAEIYGYYQLGMSDAAPSGLRNVANVVVKSAAGAGGTTYVLGTDYALDTARGRIQILAGGAIVAGGSVFVTYDTTLASRETVISGATPIEGYLRYLAHNPVGKDFDYFLPWVKVRPSGDYALITDEWQSLPLSVEIMKLPNREAAYMDGQKIGV